MSKIQEALRRLQNDPTAKADKERKIRQRKGFQASDGSPSLVPLARKKKDEIDDGEQHEINQSALVEGGLLAPLDSAIHIADEFRQIKRPLIRRILKGTTNPDEHMNVIMVASAMPKAGKTFCSVNLAVSISLERELSVLLVDADVPKPHISREFGLADRPGLIDLLVDDSRSIEESVVRTNLNGIHVLPAGREHPQATELLASQRMSEIVAELSMRYPDRVILLDSPPLLITSEAQALSAQVGQIVVVVEAGQTNQQMLGQTLDVLDSDKAVNLVLNKSLHGSKDGYYGAEYGYYGFDNA